MTRCVFHVNHCMCYYYFYIFPTYYCFLYLYETNIKNQESHIPIPTNIALLMKIIITETPNYRINNFMNLYSLNSNDFIVILKTLKFKSCDLHNVYNQNIL